MLDEIAEQPLALEKTIQSEREKIRQLVAHLKRRDIRLIVLVARGSSDNAALFGRYLLEMATGIPVSLAAPSVYTIYDARLRLNDAVVIGVSQSGEGEDINLVLTRAKEAGAFTLGITNEAASTMSGLVDEVLVTQAERERSVAATKTYTGQLLLFYMLTAALAEGQGLPSYEAVPSYVEKALRLREEVETIAQRYVFMENCIVAGRGLAYANAYEMALKLMETCYVVAERFSYADLLHGPLAMVDRHFPIILFAPSGRIINGLDGLLSRLNELKADTLAITADEKVARASSRVLRMPPDIPEPVAPIPYIIPGQLFAALLAEARGLDPDAPRSLSKVTRTL